MKTNLQPLRVHCFTGGKSGVQHGPLLRAKTDFFIQGYFLVWESMDIDAVKQRKWSPAALVDWLSHADIYLIISHLHQGLLDRLCWNMDDLKLQLRSLYNRVGFPSYENLFCPVFLQDKYAYIEAIPEICNPTLRVDFKSQEPLSRAQSHEFSCFREASIAR